MRKIPNTCTDVKCMQNSCKNQAAHKVGEENIYFQSEEPEEFKAFESQHNLTTYLCEEHFQKLMKREEYYGDISKYKHPTSSLDGCPFHYCDRNPKCEIKCRYAE